MRARCILHTIPRTYHMYTHAHTYAHSFAIHCLSPLAPSVVICRACDDHEGRDSLEATWDVPFLIRSRCKSKRSLCPLPLLSPPPWYIISLSLFLCSCTKFLRQILINRLISSFMVSHFEVYLLINVINK